MPASRNAFRIASFLLFILLFAAIGLATVNLNTATMAAVTVAMFCTCAASAMHLFGVRTALAMAPLAVAIGFFAEYTGAHYGWFFGDYQFTDALGLRLAGVPVVIPMMWFGLTYVCMVLANLILFRSPLAPSGLGNALASSFLCALLVTAYDLGMDPYMVFVVKAWIMTKTDGWWFGETLQGFVGWMTIAFVIAMLFNWLTSVQRSSTPPATFRKLDALLPVLMYANQVGFQVMYGHPVETRTVAFFAMGIPLAIALLSVKTWSWHARVEGAQ
jgi:putative membrane protein